MTGFDASSSQIQVLRDFKLVVDLILLFLSNKWLKEVLDGKYSQEYSINAVVPEDPILGPTFFLLHIYRMILSVILPSMLMILLSTLDVIWLLILCQQLVS